MKKKTIFGDAIVATTTPFFYKDMIFLLQKERAKSVGQVVTKDGYISSSLGI